MVCTLNEEEEEEEEEEEDKEEDFKGTLDASKRGPPQNAHNLFLIRVYEY